LLFGLQEQAAKEALAAGLAARDVQEAKKVNAFVQSNFLCTLHICLPY
jgi:hypothetical protein